MLASRSCSANLNILRIFEIANNQSDDRSHFLKEKQFEDILHMVEDDFVATFLINMAQFTEFEAF